MSKRTVVVVGDATLEQVNRLVELGLSRDKAKMLSKTNAQRRIRQLELAAHDRNNGRSAVSRSRRSRNAVRLSCELLVNKNVWPRITRLAENHATNSMAAVAFFGKGGADLLPLAAGSILVVNMSKEAVMRGLTNPAEVKRLVLRGVDVHSSSSLHAKVFVLGEYAIVGSANASHSSAIRLVEAAVESTDLRTVRACRKFVKGLLGDAVTPEYAEQMVPLFGTSMTPENGSRGRKDGKDGNTKVWLLRIPYVDLDRHDEAATESGTAAAEAGLSPGDRYSVDSFCWTGGVFQRHCKKHDQVMQLVSEDGEWMLYPPAKLLHLEPYVKPDGTEWFLEEDAELPAMPFDSAIYRVRPLADDLRRYQRARVLDSKRADALRRVFYDRRT